MLFKGFYGNRGAKEQLAASFESGRVPHALLIEGPSGCGKKTLAKIIAAACVCTGSADGRPCGECVPCKKAFSGNHPDIKIISGGASARSFSVDAARQVREEAYVVPNEAENKVFILADIQNMTEQAQNALLKVIEEPPKHAVFLMTCDSRSHVLETVRSRCRAVTVGPVSMEEAAAALQENGAEPNKATYAAQLAGGNIGLAKAALEDEQYNKAAKLAEEVADALCGCSEYGLLSLSGRLEKDSGLTALFLPMLPLVFRDAVSVRVSGAAMCSGCPQAAKKIASVFTLKQIEAMLDVSLEAREALDRYANRALLLTWLFSRLRLAKTK